mmetsp:Transcript_62997/g.111907  ORF Transcript_62997/g.111907 Transcript_62997/m.111907 type:complete len:590 (-) Transcript_62997:345-2114(-)|eukprot:CAMPEP_0197628016 /NCGR_PEP_ID=MMETSP1338-20131121/6455_1 /TAXON_ID=43686 ORGANISM="Pelagodinium beii, Strain RCC1491" /NCGR_SAMPLE_ID=MMETSP1338 /ASSEMBLY_ACC=CAM_ASM_000754 /LENGTH=589 /DNA_ID=CAMNT_0043198889 /DNA_START=106 /DNA_END=1875 /DNA_ORIENTATION=+
MALAWQLAAAIAALLIPRDCADDAGSRALVGGGVVRRHVQLLVEPAGQLSADSLDSHPRSDVHLVPPAELHEKLVKMAPSFLQMPMALEPEETNETDETSESEGHCPASVNVCEKNHTANGCLKSCDELGCLTVAKMLSNPQEYQKTCGQCKCFKKESRRISICGKNHTSGACLRSCQETGCQVVKEMMPARYDELCSNAPCYAEAAPTCPQIIHSPTCGSLDFSPECFKSCEEVGCDLVNSAHPTNYNALCGGCSCYKQPSCGKVIGICPNKSSLPGCLMSCQDVGCATVKKNLPAQFDDLCSGCPCLENSTTSHRVGNRDSDTETKCPKTVNVCAIGQTGPECFKNCDEMGCDNVRRKYPAQYENQCSTCTCYQKDSCQRHVGVCKSNHPGCRKNCDDVGCHMVQLDLPKRYDELCSGCSCYLDPVPVCPKVINSCAPQNLGPGCMKNCDQVGCDVVAQKLPKRYEALCGQCQCNQQRASNSSAGSLSALAQQPGSVGHTDSGKGQHDERPETEANETRLLPHSDNLIAVPNVNESKTRGLNAQQSEVEVDSTGEVAGHSGRESITADVSSTREPDISSPTEFVFNG